MFLKKISNINYIRDLKQNRNRMLKLSHIFFSFRKKNVIQKIKHPIFELLDKDLT